MNILENFELSFAFPSYWLVIGSISAAILVYFYYRFTIPPISKLKRIFLSLLRFLVLFLILMMIFEPVLKLEYKKMREPQLFLFVDNSKSMLNYDSTNVRRMVGTVVDELNEVASGKIKSYSFGENVEKLDADSLETMRFNNRFTNFERIAAKLETTDENIGGVVIISDGNFNQGADPLEKFSRLGIPLITIGIGDTSSSKDIELNRAFINSFIYAGTETQIEAVVFNKGFGAVPTKLTLYQNSKIIEAKSVTLNPGGINRIRFKYTPETPGNFRMRLSAAAAKGEKNTSNNNYYFNITVLDSKLKILLVSGALHPDIAAVRGAMLKNENFSVNSITEISDTKTIENWNDSTIDSADVFVLMGFPARSSNPELFAKIKSALVEDEKSAFFQLTPKTDISKLVELEEILPFQVESANGKSGLVQIELTDPFSPIWGESSVNISKWRDMPPVFQNTDLINPAPGAHLLAESKIRNINTGVPLIISRKLGKHRMIAVLASSIYRWKIRPDNSSLLFDEFIQNAIKWLSVSNRLKRFRLSANKKIYAAGEPVNIRAEVYDENFYPKSGAEVTVNYNKDLSVLMTPAAEGIYEGIVKIPASREITFAGKAIANDYLIGLDTLKIDVVPLDYEKLESGLNQNYLKLISNETNGYYLYIDKANNSIENIVKNLDTKVRIDRSSEEINVWSYEIMLAFLILLLAAEWFERKRNALL